jgi:hypothetical protein
LKSHLGNLRVLVSEGCLTVVPEALSASAQLVHPVDHLTLAA